MINKKGFDFNFSWLFALVIGAVIIFLAIYFVSTYSGFQRKSVDSLAGKQFSILLYPTGADLDNDKIDLISFPIETHIDLKCDSSGNFGTQLIQTSGSSTIGKEYSESGIYSKLNDRYIFSNNQLEGKDFLVFVKSLNLPFKIADVILLIPTNKKYCFVSSPNKISDEIEKFKLQNSKFNESFFLADTPAECPRRSEKVCFSGGDCETKVYPLTGKVIKGDKSVFFGDLNENDALLYGAIFSDLDNYECQIKRLMLRTSAISNIYLEKGETLSPPSCGAGLTSQLFSFVNITQALNSSLDLKNILSLSNEIQNKNKDLSCPLF